MMRVIGAAAMREVDRRTIEELGLPGIVLMETAARRVTEVVLRVSPSRRPVVVLSGPGNNGGDGLAVARQLSLAGRPVSLFTTAREEEYRGDARINYHFLRQSGFPLQFLAGEENLAVFEAALDGAGLAVDALLGTGLSRPVEGLPAALIERLNRSDVPVLAVDIPSGVCADSGAVLGCAVRARWTVTFAFPKLGLLLHPGAELAGECVVGDIGIPSFLVREEPVALTTVEEVGALLPARPQGSHKGTFGRVLLLAGSAGMTGAAALAAHAALRGGAGLVYVCVPGSLRPVLESKVVEAIVRGVCEIRPGEVAAAAAETLLAQAGACRVFALGPGLVAGEELARLLQSVVPRSPCSLVLDAGALEALAGRVELLRQARFPVVLTPHPGEMARLIGTGAAAVQRARIETACGLARRAGCVVVLKGAHTLIAAPEGRLWFNPTGGPALATAGSGDVLTGIIAAFLAQGLSPVDAARAGVFIHGLAGDLLPPRGGAAGDLLSRLPKAFQLVEENGKGSGSLWGPCHQPIRPL